MNTYLFLLIPRIRQCKLFIFFFLLVIPNIGLSQTDNVNWSSIQFQTKLSESFTLNVKPIIRFDNDISEYQNTSLDIAVKKTFKKGWSAQIVERTWFLPDARPRQFLWADVAHGFGLKNVKIDNRLRWHWALDINNRKDPDYIRLLHKISFLTSKKFNPYLGFESWFRVNRENQFQRIRIEPGFKWKFSKNYHLDIQYRRENWFNLENAPKINFLVANLLIKI